MHSAKGEAEEELYRMQAEFCKGMAHPKRIHILKALKNGEMSVNGLAKLLKTPQANVSQHLTVLRQLGLLRTRRDGSNVYYSIVDERIIEACDLVRGCIEERLRKSHEVFAVAPQARKLASLE